MLDALTRSAKYPLVLALLGGTPVRQKPWPEWPEHGEEERAALERVLASGNWGGFPAPGEEARRFQASWAAKVGVRHAVLAANGTVTLKVVLRALGVQAGDEVIVPSLTWVATASAVAYVNAVPVFVDVDPETLCIDPGRVVEAITSRTKAIIAVHLASAMADMDRLQEISARHGIRLIEDCAHAHGARWRGKHAGSLSDAGSFSFQSSKLLTAGEGGAITTDSQDLAERCQSLVNCGRKDPGYDDFSDAVFGWNGRITEMQAALLSAQLSRLDEQSERRIANVRHLEARLAELDLGLVPQRRDARITGPTFYQFVLRFDSKRWRGLSRDRFVEALEAEGVPADGAFYRPIPDRTEELFPLQAREYPCIRARYGEALTSEHAPSPVAARAAYEETVWLHHSLFLGSTSDVDDIVEAIVRIREGLDALL